MSWRHFERPLEPRATDEHLADRFIALRPGSLITVVGTDAVTLADRVPPGAPSLLQLDLAGVSNHTAAVACILDDLAALALRGWPAWPTPSLASWGRAANRMAGSGRLPRFRQIAQETQFHQLIAAAGAPAILFSIDTARQERAAPMISALEWCCRHGAAAVALLAEAPPCEPPWDRVLYGAITLEHAPRPAAARLVDPSQGVSVPRGSAIEKRMREALAADNELAGLFEDEVTLRLGPLGPTPRVDLLWRGGKVVVELDGIEHERRSNYGADRHRDYELLIAGYLVLRLTNTEVALDLGRSLEKVRRIVNLRRSA